MSPTFGNFSFGGVCNLCQGGYVFIDITFGMDMDNQVDPGILSLLAFTLQALFGKRDN